MSQFFRQIPPSPLDRVLTYLPGKGRFLIAHSHSLVSLVIDAFFPRASSCSSIFRYVWWLGTGFLAGPCYIVAFQQFEPQPLFHPNKHRFIITIYQTTSRRLPRQRRSQGKSPIDQLSGIYSSIYLTTPLLIPRPCFLPLPREKKILNMMSLKILELSYVTSVSLRRELIIRKLLTSFPICPSCISLIVKLVPELVADNLPPLVKFQPATITGKEKPTKKMQAQPPQQASSAILETSAQASVDGSEKKDFPLKFCTVCASNQNRFVNFCFVPLSSPPLPHTLIQRLPPQPVRMHRQWWGKKFLALPPITKCRIFISYKGEDRMRMI